MTTRALTKALRDRLNKASHQLRLLAEENEDRSQLSEIAALSQVKVTVDKALGHMQPAP